MKNEDKTVLYNCILKQFPDPGLYKVSRISEWLCTNDLSMKKLGYGSFRELAEDFPEMFAFQSDNNNEFIETKKWEAGEHLRETGNGSEAHPADSFFGTNNIILNDDIIEMTQQSLYALTKILDNGSSVSLMKQDIYSKFENAKLNGQLTFNGERYTFPIGKTPEGSPVAGIVTKNTASNGKSLYFSFERSFGGRSAEKPEKPEKPEKQETSLGKARVEIPENDKNKMYKLLTDNFPKGSPIHLATVSTCLLRHGVNHNKYGFMKQKELLAALDFLELEDIEQGGVRQTLVTIKEPPGAAPAARTPAADAPAEAAAPRPTRPARPRLPIPKGELTEFCSLPVKPMSILEQFLRDSGTEASYESISRHLNYDFDKARRDGAVRIDENKMSFAVRYQKADGSRVEITLKPNAYEGKKWFLYYVDTVVHEKNFSINPAKQLESFAFLCSWSAFLSDLASKAASEKWDFRNTPFRNYHILMQHIKFTFARLVHENKVCVSSDRQFAAFNTNLTDERCDDIYACFTANEPGETEWKYAGFCTAASGELGKRLVNSFDPLPAPPVYFEKKEDMIYDGSRQLHIDHEHLAADNLRRLPRQFLREQLFDSAEAMSILEKPENACDKYERAAQYERLRNLIAENGRLSDRLQNRVRDVVELVQKRARKNYKLAVPAYYPKHNIPIFLLPLAFGESSKPDAALAVEITRTGSYQGLAVLTMPQAYINARLVCDMSEGWLAPDAISLEASGEAPDSADA